MRDVFVDTAGWIGLINRSDQLFVQAQQTLKSLRLRKAMLVTTEFVLIEVADALSSPALRFQTATFIDGLRSLSQVRIIPLSQDLLLAGWSLYRQRPDKEWGLTDCISFVVMGREQIVEAMTSDHHFEQAGFVKLLTASHP